LARASSTEETDSAQHVTRAGAVLKFDKSVPVVQTSGGQLRGYIRNGVHTFKGIPYGASTAGKNRFMPPVKPEPWKGIFNAVAYGYACLQVHGNDWQDSVSHFALNFENGMMSEDCLKLNVWTQAVDSGKRPVFVWIHGGGFSNGSSFEMLPYDGENFCRRGDIVFVSLNHRLNALGFLDLSTVGGPEFASSANVGMLDLVAALEWVRDNIAQFGGDPGNVTICGQSGGGAKVNALMAMPSARGLFHKGIVQSGSFRMYLTPDDSRLIGEGIAKKLNLQGRDLTQLQELPYDRLFAVADETIKGLSQAGSKPAMGRLGWVPTVDGKVIVSRSPDKLSPDIPLIVGYTRNEMATRVFDPTLDDLNEEELLPRLQGSGARNAPELLALYRSKYPNATSAFLYTAVMSMLFADPAMAQVEQRAASGGALVYAYRFDWCPEIYDGRLGAFHSLEIAFTFDNTDRWDSATGGGERAQALASVMSQAWINFARSGNPNHRALTRWAAYNNEQKSYMIFNDTCVIESGPDQGAHQILNPQ
jgi:para-nitrobenzyl esterase